MQIALAPIAVALKTSVPRRKPPSIITGIRPFTASITSGSASMVLKPLSSCLPPWFRYEDAVHTAVDALGGVLASEDSLDHDLHVRDLADLVDKVPGDWPRGALYLGIVDAFEGTPAAEVPLSPFGVAQLAIFAIPVPGTLGHFAVRSDGYVGREHKHRTAGLFAAVDDLFGHVPVSRWVDLKP